MSKYESQLTAQQRKAAYLLVENELRENTDVAKLDLQDIAQEVGVTSKTLWEWRTKNRNFIAYKNEIADDFLADKRDRVYAQLLKLINGSQPSVKAIDLFMRRFGLLTDKQVTETIDPSAQRSEDEIRKQLDDLDALLDDGDKGTGR